MTAELKIETSVRGNSTFLKTAYCTHPFKIANITENKKDTVLRLMLMSSSPGILDGDRYKIRIDLPKGCSLRLQTQAYQRLFKMKDGASQDMEVYLEEGASFCYLPHPCVPHESSLFVAKNMIFISDNCNLTWGEVLTCGRKLSGEAFMFSSYQSLTQIYFNNKLIVKENLRMQPSIADVHCVGQLEGYTHQATLIYLSGNAIVKNLITGIAAFLSTQHDITFGITSTIINGVLIRLLGFKAEQLFDCINSISQQYFIPQQHHAA